MTRTHRTEHPDVNIDDVAPQLLDDGWTDESWHNDQCPAFWSPARDCCLWVEGADVSPRFVLQAISDDELDHDAAPLYVGDDLTEALIAAEDHHAGCPDDEQRSNGPRR